MDKEEFRIKLEEINLLVEKKDYKGAMSVVDSIDWRRVKNVRTLCVVGEIYAANKRYEESKEIFLLAYHRSSIGKNILYRLIEVSLKMGDIDEAMEYFEEYMEVAPNDNMRYILRYKIYKAKKASLKELIQILEEYKEKEFTERWSYELANLYYQAGEKDKCLDLCNQIVIWFNEGKYVMKALDLKQRLGSLTGEEKERYEQQFVPNLMTPGEAKTLRESGQVLKKEETKTSAQKEVKSLEEESPIIESIRLDEKDINNAESLQEKISKGIRDIFSGKKKEKDEIFQEEEEFKDEDENVQGEMIRNISSKLDYVDVPDLEPEDEEKKENIPVQAEPVVGQTEEKQDLSQTIQMPSLKIPKSMKNINLQKNDIPKAPVLVSPMMQDNEIIKDKQEDFNFNLEDTILAAATAQGIEIPDAPASSSQDGSADKKEEPEMEEIAEDILAEKEVTEKELLSEDEELEEEETLSEDEELEEEEALSEDEELEEEDTLSEDEELEEEDTLSEDEELEEEEVLSEDEPWEEELLDEDDIEYESDEDEAWDEEDSLEDIDELEEEEASEEDGSSRKTEVPSLEEEEFLTEEDLREAEEEFLNGPVKKETPTPSKRKHPDGMSTEIFNFQEEIKKVLGENESLFGSPDEADTLDKSFLERNGLVTDEGIEEPAVQDTADEEEIFDDIDKPRKAIKSAEEKRDRKKVSRHLTEEEELEEFVDSIHKKNGKSPYDIIPRERKLTDDEKKLFTYFVRVPGMKEQLIDTLCDVQMAAADKTSRTGNVIVMGGRETGKTRLISSLIPAICKELNLEASKVAYVFADQINGKDMSRIVNKLAGGFLVIENANQLTQETAEQLDKAMEFRTDGLTVIVEDEKIGMRKFMARYPKLAKKFTSMINIPVFTNDELVGFAKVYTKENGYTIDQMGMLALYNMIGMNQKEDEPMNVGAVKNLIDAAIAKSQGGIRKLQRNISKKRTDHDGYIVLYEKDFS